MRKRQPTMARRTFLKTASTAGAAMALSSTRRAAAVGANERVNVALIGCGGMGEQHISQLMKLREEGLVNIVAVCDVWDKRLDDARRKTGVEGYKDYRKILERKDIDTVSIVTPDHWHAKMTIEAADAGKDVYCEKPMTYWKNLDDARAVVKAIARNKRVMQVGTNGMALDKIPVAREKIGLCGPLLQAQAGDMRNFYIGCYDPKQDNPGIKPGENLDWKMWQGPTEERPFDSGRFLAFRCFWDYSGGLCTDLFPHLLTPMLYIMGLKFPKRVTSSGGLYFFKDKGWQIPDMFSSLIEYPEGPQVYLTATLASECAVPWVIRGQKASLSLPMDHSVVIEPEPKSDVQKMTLTPPVAERSLKEHYRDFLRCVHTREKPRSHELLGYQVMVAVHMGVRSYLEKKVFEFDAEKEEVKPA